MSTNVALALGALATVIVFWWLLDRISDWVSSRGHSNWNAVIFLAAIVLTPSVIQFSGEGTVTWFVFLFSVGITGGLMTACFVVVWIRRAIARQKD